MKKTLLAGIITFLILGGCTLEKNSPMEGAWKLAYEYEVTDGLSTVIFPGVSQGSEIKIWSGNQFALVGVFLQDSSFTDNFAGGSFSIEGTSYKEVVGYHSAEEYLGQTVNLYLEIKGDTLTQIWPVDENGVPIESHHYMEKWVRME